MKNKVDLIIGFGEIGKSLYNVLKEKYTVEAVDINTSSTVNKCEVMHICFPYSKEFVREVKRYKKLYKPKYIVIHSTVPMKTAKKCKSYYSPVRGIHPHLEQSLKTFVKYLAPRCEYLVKYFNEVGISVEEHDSQESLEVMKLYCTTLYGLNIIAEKEIYNFCKKHDLDFDMVYSKSNQTYNEGYEKIGFPQYTRYNLNHVDGKIGGHCVIPNCDLLKTDIAKFIIKQNNKL
jgi:predicted dinucleotide-binding enzyme